MPTVVGVQTGLNTGFGASPRTATVTAPGTGNSLGVVLISTNGATVTNVGCGDGTSTFLYTDPDNYQHWIISGITNGATSVSVEFSGGGNSEFDIDKVEFAGGIQQHNAQEGTASAFGDTEIGPSLTSTAASIGGFGHYLTVASVTVTPSAGVSVAPVGADTSHLLYTGDLGAAGTYTFGGSISAATSRRVSGVLVESVASSPARPVIFAGLRQRMNN